MKVTEPPKRGCGAVLLFGLIGQILNQSESTVVLIGLTVLTCAFIWRLVRWVAESPVQPDPWNEEVAAEALRDHSPQLCHRCLTPQDSSFHFCQHCGAMVGLYTCLVPPLYYYSIGDVFRAGVEGTYRRSWLLTGGYLFVGLNYLYWVPFPFGLIALFIYWKNVWKGIPKRAAHPKEYT